MRLQSAVQLCLSLGSFPTPCPWELGQKDHSTRRVFADQESTNTVGRGSIARVGRGGRISRVFIDFMSLELEVPTIYLVIGGVSVCRDRRYGS
jgi:hypothetical protein